MGAMNFVLSSNVYDKNSSSKHFHCLRDKPCTWNRKYLRLKRTKCKTVLFLCCTPQVMVNGLPGKMSSEVFQVVLERNLPYDLYRNFVSLVHLLLFIVLFHIHLRQRTRQSCPIAQRISTKPLPC